MKARYKYPWQQFYFAAVSDVHAETLHSKIAIAREALDERVAELLTKRRGDEERQAIIDALFSLRILEMYTDSNSEAPESLHNQARRAD